MAPSSLMELDLQEIPTSDLALNFIFLSEAWAMSSLEERVIFFWLTTVISSSDLATNSFSVSMPRFFVAVKVISSPLNNVIWPPAVTSTAFPALASIRFPALTVYPAPAFIRILVPAVRAFSEEAANDDILAAAGAAAKASAEGARATEQMIARRGRGFYVADRGLGTADPGAASLNLIVQTIYKELLKEM